ncbi:hypothetical protein PAPYR_1843 [Paratrimastix pyriformis]|uniref:DUF1349 domain-containing protein n=1 Tax=Paratrimastix pyriformis TaxID=342808 RepID=A0ABQ8URG3_9EUKA|nr:hypothetical protein PAPYR_1843 [Paratrimastix pyriformis]|eukprot:GAFH01005192.1.p2 GENE.GAFH01005192.1~~GAFH01005192.1.p2  ORF type:complete len:219 (-),score=11.48 GAFH01005192.1:23-640(-)
MTSHLPPLSSSNIMNWTQGTWTHPPLKVSSEDGTDMLVHCAEGSDAWRTTSYGFIHDSEHALIAPLAPGHAVEVTFTPDFDHQFDQAGVFLSANNSTWIKAGVEFCDGAPQLGAVVTLGKSDWSVAPVPEWAGHRVTIRASRSGDAVTIRAWIDGNRVSSRLVRVCPFPAEAAVSAGPFCCAPTRAGLVARFHSWVVTPADGALH